MGIVMSVHGLTWKMLLRSWYVQFWLPKMKREHETKGEKIRGCSTVSQQVGYENIPFFVRSTLWNLYPRRFSSRAAPVLYITLTVRAKMWNAFTV